MTVYKNFQYQGQNQHPLSVIRRDISGGINNRQHGTNISENQVESLSNVDISIPGLAVKRKGTNLIEKLGTDAGTGAFAWEPVGGSNELIVTHGTKLEGWTGSGTFTEHDTGFTTGLQTTFVKAIKSDGTSLLLVSNGTDNVHEMTPAHAFTDLDSEEDDPVKTTVMTFYRNRLWTLKDEQLAYSDAAPDTYDGCMNNADYWIPVGNEVALVGTRELGLFIIGSLSTYTLNPSATPADTDKPEKLFDISAVATKSFIPVGDDIIGLYRDGVRAVRRTAEDKLQLGTSYPLSYIMKDEVASVNWEYAHKASAVWFDNQYLISLPVNGSTINNEVWAYYPAIQAWSVFRQSWAEQTGTVSTSGASTTVTGSGTTFASQYSVGDTISFGTAGSTQRTVDAIATDTSMTVSSAVTLSSSTAHFKQSSALNVADWAKISIDGEERLFFIDSNEAAVYEMFVNDNDEDSSGNAENIEYVEIGRKEDLGDPHRRKNGGEVTIRAEATGATSINVYAQFDDGGFSSLGSVDVTGNTQGFPLTFPVSFKSPNIVYSKFHLDDKGSWYTMQLKLVHDEADDCRILERTIVSFPEEYISEESA